MPVKHSGKVEKVVRKVQGFGGWAKARRDVGTRGPSCHAGIAPQREEGQPG